MKTSWKILWLPALLLLACDRDEPLERPQEAGELYHGMIELGEKLDDPYTVANIQAASQAAQGAINAVAAGGSMLGTPSADASGVKPITTDANGTPVGTIDAKKVVDPTTPAYNPLLDEYQLA